MGAFRTTYVIAACAFAAGLVVQVFLIGMVLVAGRWNTAPHVTLGHALVLPLVVMLIAMYPARLPLGSKALTWVLLAVYVVQADILIQLRTSVPVAGAFHPVLALVDAVLAPELVRRTLGARSTATEAPPSDERWIAQGIDSSVGR